MSASFGVKPPKLSMTWQPVALSMGSVWKRRKGRGGTANELPMRLPLGAAPAVVDLQGVMLDEILDHRRIEKYV